MTIAAMQNITEFSEKDQLTMYKHTHVSAGTGPFRQQNIT